MNRDRSSDPADARLAALYQAQLPGAEQPSAASDARILALARDAVARPAAKPVASGWASRLTSGWFGPGLAFATVAALSVVVVSLMPKEDLSIEKAITAAPVTPPQSASSSIIAAPGTPAQQSAPATSVAAPKPTRPPSAESASALPESGVDQAPVGHARVRMAPMSEAALPLPRRSAPTATLPAASAPPSAPPAATASVGKAAAPRIEADRAPAPKAERPNPFPGQSPPAAAIRAEQAAAAAGDAGAAQRLEKPSLLSEPTESRMTASQPLPEVRDSVPTYPGEMRPSGPLPSTLATPRAPARDAASGGAAGTGSLAGRALQSQQSAAMRKEVVTDPRADKPAPAAAGAATGATTMAAAPPLRDPVEWIKAIQKLRAEGRSEQVTRELTEFRRRYPLYPLPDELKPLVK